MEILLARGAPYKSKEIHSYESELSRADLFVFTDFVGDLFSIFRCSMRNLLSDNLLWYIGTSEKRTLKK